MRSTGSELPYEPSAPCATCARGVDPLRAACVSVSEEGIRYFCTRACRDAYARTAADRERAHVASRTPPPARFASSPSFEPIARRVAPARASTPIWAPLTSGLAAVAATLTAGDALAGRLAALVALGAGAVLAIQTPRSRDRDAPLAWLGASLGVGLSVIACLLEPRLAWVATSAAGVALMWLREHLSERSEARFDALALELGARLAGRAQALATLREGDALALEAPDTVPVDSVVTEGSAEVLPYPLARTPLVRAPGASLLAGAQIVRGALRVRARRVGTARTLFRPFHEPEPTRRQGLLGASRAIALVAALLLAAGLSAPTLAAALASLGAGLLALPALALARGMRAPWRAALTSGAARGVHFRDRASVERAGRLDTAVLPIESALLEGGYTLAEICPLGTSHDARELLALALAAESAVESHPLARAVRDHAARLEVVPAVLRRLSRLPGRGVSALTDGQGALVFGSRDALLSAGVSVAVADREAQRAELAGQKVVFLAVGGHVRGLFVFAQTMRPEARVAVQTLFDLGLDVEIVSGDHRGTVEAIARSLDVSQLKAELSGEQRAAEVQRLRDGEARVVALGRRPEDEPLLAAADLALVLDGAADPGEHDLATASGDLRDAAEALIIARGARRHGQRVLAACAVGAASAMLGALGLAPPLLAIALAAAVDLSCLREAPPPFRPPPEPARAR